MSDSVTARDRVWAAVLDRIDGPDDQVKLGSIHRDLRIDLDDPPSRETVRRVMGAMTELGVLSHRSGSPWWRDNR